MKLGKKNASEGRGWSCFLKRGKSPLAQIALSILEHDEHKNKNSGPEKNISLASSSFSLIPEFSRSF